MPLADRADLILTDLKLPGMTGLEMLQIIRRQNRARPVIVMTAFGTVENAVEAMKAGAADFLLKPFSLDHLITVVNKALEVRNLRDENRQLKEELGQHYDSTTSSAAAPACSEIFATIDARCALARHGAAGRRKRRGQRSDRARHPLTIRRAKTGRSSRSIAPRIPENLMESELFGYEKGAFTGANIDASPANSSRPIPAPCFWTKSATCPPAIQVKLLRVLQEREFERLGSNKTRHIDVRVIAATNAICAPRSKMAPSAKISITASR